MVVEFFRKGIYVIGFLIVDKNILLKEFLEDKEIVNVFVLIVFNLIFGFLLCVLREDIYLFNMIVEWVFKFIVLGGYIIEELVKEKEEKIIE